MATRLFFDSAVGAVVSVIADAGWEDSSGIVQNRLNNTKGTSTLTDVSAKTSTAGQDRCHEQFVSFPMDSGISFNAATCKCQVMAQESGVNDNATSRMGARIVSRDGATVRQTLFSVANFGPTTEFNTANRNKTFADGDTVTGTYTTVDGDRLVIEIGHSDASGTTISCQTQYGEGSGSDLLENETATTGNPWIEFSNTITFQAEAAPSILSNIFPQTGMII